MNHDINQQTPKLYIAGMGMITPVGGDSASTAAAVKADVNCYKISSEYHSKNGKPFTMAFVPKQALPAITYKLTREKTLTTQIKVMLAMADVALKQAMAHYPDEKAIPLYFSCPESWPHNPGTVQAQFITHLVKQSDNKIDKNTSRLFSTGRAGVLDAIELATRYLQQTDADYVLVGGADSYQNESLLADLDSQDRVLAENVKDGFAPGEAAGFLLLTKNINKALKNNQGVIHLSAPGIAQEHGHMYSNETYQGNGLAEAFTQALNNHQGEKIQSIYSSMNGEHFWAKEYGVASIRNKKHLADDLLLEHPADCFGDSGASVGAILISLAAIALQKEGKKKTRLVSCSSDGAGRAAICVNFETLT